MLGGIGKVGVATAAPLIRLSPPMIGYENFVCEI